MDEHPDSALHYGHVGRAVYLPETKNWTFARSFARPPSITYTGLTKHTVPSHSNTRQPQPPPKTARQADEKLIPKAHPDLAVNWSSIRDDAFSKVVTSASDLYNPQVSSLFDIGYALDHASDDAKSIPGPIPIAAVVTGESRDTVAFRMMVEDLAEPRYVGSALHVPSIGNAETTEWSQRRGPVQQICFARPVEEKGTWMAARQADSITVFRPVYQRDPVPMRIHDDDLAVPLRNSRLDANPVVEVTNILTGGLPHADVTFNPWYPRQLGIVDTHGNWSIWEITGRQRRRKATWAAKKVTISSLPLMNDKPASYPRHDGWASIEWIADFSTIVVSDRRCAMLYQLIGKEVRPSVVELGMTKQSEWILDVQRSTRNPSHFFILTTSRLFWFDINTAPLDRLGKRPPLRSRLAWRHFRDPEDTTLRLSDLLINDNLHLVLYSQLTQLVQVFPCPFMVDEQTESASVPDPFILDVPSAEAIDKTSSAQFSTFVFREVGYSPAHAGKMDYNPNMTIIKLFWADPSLAVHESLFKGPDWNRERNEKDMPLDEVSNVLHLKKHFPPRKQRADIDDDNFVVDDWDESVVSTNVGLHQTGPKASATDLPWDADLQWTSDWTAVYTLAVTNLAALANQSDGGGSGFTFDDIIENLTHDTTETLAEFQASETMLELSGNRPELNDIDDAANDLARIVSTVFPESSEAQAQGRYMILPLQFSNLFHGMPTIPSAPKLNFLETYNHLVAEWVTSLPHGAHGIPNQTRVLKEKIIRGIALDILLARLIRISNVSSDDNISRAGESADKDVTEKEHMTTSQGSRPLLSSSQIPHFQRLATAENGSKLPSGERSSDRPREAPTSTYSGLSAYTTFRELRPTPRNVANLLSHWKMGVDPSTYEWQKTSQLLENTPEPSTPRHRVRKKRSQLTPAPDAASLPPTPVAPMIRTWGSQPDIPAPPMPFPSSQPTVDEVAMTQVERGQFGAREAKKSSKSKKKRRAAGF